MSDWTRDLDADARDYGHLPHATHDGARPNVIHQYIARVRELEAENVALRERLEAIDRKDEDARVALAKMFGCSSFTELEASVKAGDAEPRSRDKQMGKRKGGGERNR
jgi:hypothetical protein